MQLAPPNSRTSYTWNNDNRQTRVQTPGGTDLQATYRYDGLRYQKAVGGTTTRFVFDGANYLLETDGSGTIQIAHTVEPQVYGKAISRRASGATLYYLFDALGSVRLLSNSAQALTDIYHYDAWGVPVLTFGPTANAFRWVGGPGYYYDTETGLYYVRARVYSAATARWMSQDPLFDSPSAFKSNSSFARTITFYQYTLNQPVRYTDPSGLIVWPHQDQLHDFQGPPPVCVARCGRDITRKLRRLLNAVDVRFNGEPIEKRRAIGNSIQSLNGWDIGDLHGYASRRREGIADVVAGFKDDAQGCGSGRCDGTVTVNSSCYWAADVNYVLFGWINRTCHDFIVWDNTFNNPNVFIDPKSFELDAILELTGLYRLPFIFDLRPAAGSTKCRQTWTKVGYDGLFFGHLAGTCRALACSPCPSQYQGTFTADIGEKVDAWWGNPIGGNTITIIDDQP